jgi:cell wall-associated NlpC family hydrolase
MVQATDSALDKRISDQDSTKLKTSTQRFVSTVKKLEVRVDAKLTSNLQAVDRAVSVCTNAAGGSLAASARLVKRLENQTQRSFHRADQRITNASNRITHIRTKTAGLIYRNTARLDQGIETSFNRVDTGLSQAIKHGVLATNSAVTAMQATSQAFERVMELGISRIDSGIDRSLTSSRAANQFLVARASNADQHLTSRLARADRRLNGVIEKVALASSQISGYATRNLTSADTRLTTGLKTTDASIDTAVTAIVSAASATAIFATRSAQLTDATLLRGVTKVDQRVEVFARQSNKASSHGSKRIAPAPALVAAGLALVLGTLGTATGTSVITAESAPIEIDNSVQNEAMAAKTVVSQYMTVRESFAALQASRSRTISTLETEIAQAQVRAQETTIDGNAVINIASKYAGAPYARGGTTPKGFDCSGFTTYVFRQIGVSLPRTSGEQAAWADRVADSDRQVGDLMFWSDRGGVHHVAIYAGDGLMWDSPRPGRRVGKISIWGDPFYGRVPAAAVNSDAIAEVADKTAELEEVIADVPRLEITVDPTPVD